MNTEEQKENERLKIMEKKRSTTFLRTSQDDFKKIASDGERIHEGQVRTSAGSLGIFKNMLEKPAKTQGIMTHIMPNEVQDYISKQVCPDCGSQLQKAESSREWHCETCNQNFASLD